MSDEAAAPAVQEEKSEITEEALKRIRARIKEDHKIPPPSGNRPWNSFSKHKSKGSQGDD